MNRRAAMNPEPLTSAMRAKVAEILHRFRADHPWPPLSEAEITRGHLASISRRVAGTASPLTQPGGAESSFDAEAFARLTLAAIGEE